MSLKLCMLASGSKGNCTYVSDGKTSLFIDLGMSYKALCLKSAEANINLNEITAVVNTHCHNDHCKGISTFIKKHDIPVFSHKDGILPLARYINIEQSRICGFDKNFTIGSLTVTPFILSHDSPVCCGFSIENGNSKISIATDLGKADEKVIGNFYESSLVVLESNHDVQMLKNGRYSYSLKKRILSDVGHLSNEDCAVVIKKLVEKGTKDFVLAHLSEENNLPELAFSCIADYCQSHSIKEGKDYNVTVAYQHKPTKVFCI